MLLTKNVTKIKWYKKLECKNRKGYAKQCKYDNNNTRIIRIQEISTKQYKG